MRAATINEQGIVTDVFLLNALSERPGSVLCPDHVSLGDDINAELPVVIPTTVSMYQARIALHQAGLLATVQAGIGQMSEEAQIKWEFAPTVKRNDALTIALASALNLTEEQLDSLFTTAAGIV
jgi:hypothetical protein